MTNRPPITATGSVPTIPEREIRDYARDHRPIDLELLKAIVWGVDETYLDFYRKKIADAQDSGGAR